MVEATAAIYVAFLDVCAHRARPGPPVIAGALERALRICACCMAVKIARGVGFNAFVDVLADRSVACEALSAGAAGNWAARSIVGAITNAENAVRSARVAIALVPFLALARMPAKQVSANSVCIASIVATVRSVAFVHVSALTAAVRRFKTWPALASKRKSVVRCRGAFRKRAVRVGVVC